MLLEQKSAYMNVFLIINTKDLTFNILKMTFNTFNILKYYFRKLLILFLTKQMHPW